ncbi:bile acid:sodium symporter [Allorhizobium sp. BGMRC 0089]|uniref:bile acid:sodium symporter family protein n=1 Tax=Allorhizobium sonneratiae TaxID=2934936 RepID=UPI00237CAB2B|nr:bile acid:sodium symporter family protein [Allorhizobium sonneratiae]MCM2293157.1 bile acid:sodium symporter [Allorhizobium sonneratiae]
MRYLPDKFTLMLVSTVLLASVMPIHGWPASYFSVATKLAIAALFFLHGARLSRHVVVAGFLHWRLHIVILMITFIIFPVLGLIVVHLLKGMIPATLAIGILYICVLPSTVQSSIAFTSVAHGNVPAAICSASASNILGMIVTPLLCGLILTSSGHGGISAKAILDIFVQLLLPFIVGQLMEPWIGDWVRRRKSLLTPIDRGSILMVVYGAFSEAMMEGIWRQYSLGDILIVIAVNAFLLMVILSFTMFGSRMIGFRREDEVAITFCGSKKSLASGVPMASAIFAGQSIGAIVMPLMLFHQMQLMACAMIAQHYVRKAPAPSELAVASAERSV